MPTKPGKPAMKTDEDDDDLTKSMFDDDDKEGKFLTPFFRLSELMYSGRLI